MKSQDILKTFKTFNMKTIKSLSAEEFESYVDDKIGDYSDKLKKKTFTDDDDEKTSYLDAIKCSAAIIWNTYKKHDEDASTTHVFNIVDAACLTLHPKSQLKDKCLTSDARCALAEMQKFKDLILLEDYSEIESQSWACVKAASSDKMSESFPAQMCLMSWFLCLGSKMTGSKIPGNKKVQVGGRIMKEREYVVRYFTIITTIAQAMYEKNKCSILKGMLKNLNQMTSEF